jgi:hypothetical protein
MDHKEEEWKSVDLIHIAENRTVGGFREYSNYLPDYIKYRNLLPR